ncbi:hypothetical protein [Caenispirillum bisanense]|uniref:hypothetical protein n=1 Tax=Caenispirillum bisanense TaxID=414052 RepID=UPI0031D5393D
MRKIAMAALWGILVLSTGAGAAAAAGASQIDPGFDLATARHWVPQVDSADDSLGIAIGDEVVLFAGIDYTRLALDDWFIPVTTAMSAMESLEADGTEVHTRPCGRPILLRSVAGTDINGRKLYLMYAGLESGRKKLLLFMVSPSREAFSAHFATFMAVLQNSTLDGEALF